LKKLNLELIKKIKELQIDLEFDYDRLSQQDEQSDERLEVAREKMNKK
jgi:hypothetical protein